MTEPAQPPDSTSGGKAAEMRIKHGHTKAMNLRVLWVLKFGTPDTLQIQAEKAPCGQGWNIAERRGAPVSEHEGSHPSPAGSSCPHTS